MTLYLCISLIATAMVLMFNQRAALCIAVLAILGGFSARLVAGEEVRSVVSDALFVVALLPIGWWASKQFLALTTPARNKGN